LKNICNSDTGLFLLGSEDATVKKAVLNIQKRFPGINVCGYNNGFIPEEEETKLVEKINNCKADILLIGMGFPLQEKFVLKYKDNLRVSLIWSVGGLFDSLSGNKKRAPVLIRKMRLEWLYRFLLEPQRMLHRNTVAALWSLSHIIFMRRSKLL